MATFVDVRHETGRLRLNLVLCVAIAWMSGGLGVVIPNLMVFWMAHGLSVRQVWVLQAGFALTLAACTVPFGFMADVRGRKFCMVVGLALHLLGELAYLTGDSFLAFLAAEVLMGVGVALVSGADSALLYDTLKVRGEEDQAPRWAGLAACGCFIVTATTNVLAGFVSAIDERLPFVVSLAFVATQLVLALLIKEPELEGGKRLVSVGQLPSVFRFCFKPGSHQLWLIGAWSIVAVVSWVAVWFYPLCFNAAGLSVQNQGAIFAFYNVVAAAAAFAARRQEGTPSAGMALLTFVGLSAVAHVLFGTFVGVWAFLFGALHQVVRGAAPVVFGNALNAKTSSEIRATVLSVQGALATLLYGGLNLRLGAYIEAFGFQAVLVSLGVGFMVAALALRAVHPREDQSSA